MSSRMLRLRRADRCASCAIELDAGTKAHWDADARLVTCASCLAAPPMMAAAATAIERGTPGASTAREYERRRHNREQRTREAHPRIGSLLLALRDDPQHEVAFRRGARGEEAVAESLERRTAESPTVLLHDRRMPGGRGNIDHLAIAPGGIFVIDAKAHTGKVSVSRALFGKPRLWIAGSDRTELLDGLDRQVAAVRESLAAMRDEAPIQGVLCFTQADLPLLGTTRIRSHMLLYRKALARRLTADGPMSPARIDASARLLSATFPPA